MYIVARHTPKYMVWLAEKQSFAVCLMVVESRKFPPSRRLYARCARIYLRRTILYMRRRRLNEISNVGVLLVRLVRISSSHTHNIVCVYVSELIFLRIILRCRPPRKQCMASHIYYIPILRMWMVVGEHIHIYCEYSRWTCSISSSLSLYVHALVVSWWPSSHTAVHNICRTRRQHT